MKQYLYSVLLGLSLIACNEPMNGDRPFLTNLDTTDTLKGIDANNDGIRDDIEKWIDDNFKKMGEGKYESMRQLARALQNHMVSDEKLKKNAEKIALDYDFGINCILKNFPTEDENSNNYWLNLTREMKAYIFNTKKRYRTLKVVSQALSGKLLKSSSPNESCEYNNDKEKFLNPKIPGVRKSKTKDGLPLYIIKISED